MTPSHHHLNLKRYKLDKGVVVAFKDNLEDAHEAYAEKLDGGFLWSDPRKIQAIWGQSSQSFQAEKRCDAVLKLTVLESKPAWPKIKSTTAIVE